jgi:hypothetical protein
MSVSGFGPRSGGGASRSFLLGARSTEQVSPCIAPHSALLFVMGYGLRVIAAASLNAYCGCVATFDGCHQLAVA